MRKQRHREVEELAQALTADKWENWEGTSQAGSRICALGNQMDHEGCWKAGRYGASGGGVSWVKGLGMNRG